jgi:hypothetical protein
MCAVFLLCQYSSPNVLDFSIISALAAPYMGGNSQNISWGNHHTYHAGWCPMCYSFFPHLHMLWGVPIYYHQWTVNPELVEQHINCDIMWSVMFLPSAHNYHPTLYFQIGGVLVQVIVVDIDYLHSCPNLVCLVWNLYVAIVIRCLLCLLQHVDAFVEESLWYILMSFHIVLHLSCFSVRCTDHKYIVHYVSCG